MRKNFFLLLFIFIFFQPAYSHYQWIVWQTENSVKNNEVSFMIGCGHRFPKSELLLKRDMITGIQLRNRELKRSVEIFRDGKFWEGSAGLSGEDSFIIEYTLRKRLTSAPFFRGRMVVCSEGCKKGDLQIFTGKGIEIIPNDIFFKKQFDYLNLKTFKAGKLISAKLTIIPEGKKPLYMHSGREGTCRIKLKYSGRYLINTFYKGEGASLTFYVKNANKIP